MITYLRTPLPTLKKFSAKKKNRIFWKSCFFAVSGIYRSYPCIVRELVNCTAIWRHILTKTDGNVSFSSIAKNEAKMCMQNDSEETRWICRIMAITVLRKDYWLLGKHWKKFSTTCLLKWSMTPNFLYHFFPRIQIIWRQCEKRMAEIQIIDTNSI